METILVLICSKGELREPIESPVMFVCIGNSGMRHDRRR